MRFQLTNRRNRSRKASGPAISTVIITGTIVTLLSVVVIFTNDLFYTRLAEDDFNSAKQYMRTIGLQIDDVSWTMGRTETVRYSSRNGDVFYEPSVLNYTVYVKTEGSDEYQFFTSHTVGVLLFNMPTNKYSVSNGYFEPLLPSSTGTLTLSGTAAPVVRVFAAQKSPMADGSFIRIVVAPSVRSHFSNVTTSDDSTFYVKLYLPNPIPGNAPRLAQTVTLTGSSVTATTIGDVSSVNVTLSFPEWSSVRGFDNSFFQFPELYEVIDVPEGYTDSVLELYTGEVTVELGVHS